MIDLSTVKELRALRLPGMARELESQLEEPQCYKALSFEERLALLVDAENVSRRKNTIQRRIHEARLSESHACVEAIEYYEDRELDKGLITKLATCAYIRDNHHVVLKGATGAGKSYIANALGVAACRQLYKVRYVRMPDLLNEYAVAKSLNTQNKVKKAYARFDLLIIDDLGTELTNSFVASQLFLCINERLLRRRSTIISTNLAMNVFRDTYSERVFSRISSGYKMRKLFGDDIRIRKKLLNRKP